MKKSFLCKKRNTKPRKICRRIFFSSALILGILTGIPDFSGIPKIVHAAELTQDTESAQTSDTTQNPDPMQIAAPSLTSTKDSIQITEFGVAQENEGIFAYCIYQDFDESNGMMQLYLEKMDEQGKYVPISYADLDVAGNNPQTTKTSPKNPTPGLYKAVLLVRHDTDKPLVRFRDSDPYEVKKSGNGLSGVHSGTDELKSSENSMACTHVLIENILRAADPSHDAVLAKCCEKCGQVFTCFEVPNSAYAAFLAESMDKIQSAPPDSLVVIDTDRWVSFNDEVLNALGERRDLSILIKYQYQGKEQQTLIPPETDTTGFADENGFCGFCHMTELLTR